MQTTIVTFDNYDFSEEGSENSPPGGDAAEFIIEALTERGVEAAYGDFLDFYAHSVDCQIDRRKFMLTIGFVGDETIMIDIGPRLSRFLRFFGTNDEEERIKLSGLLDRILKEHGFQNIRWWTSKEWSGPAKVWSAAPL